jgi:hypothetical protein
MAGRARTALICEWSSSYGLEVWEGLTMFARRVLVPLFCLCVAAAGSAGVASAATAAVVTDLYVATDGSDTNACTTKIEPCHSITHAISLAATSGTTIHVAAGTYQETVAPGTKHVTVVGAGRNLTSGTIIAAFLGAAVVVDDPAGMLTLKSLAFGGDPIGAYVTAGTLHVSQASVAKSPCGLFMTDGSVTLTDSVIDRSGITDRPDCSPLANSPVAVTVNGGRLATVRSKLVDTKDEPGIVVTSGTFTAMDSEFSDLAYINTNNNPTVQIAGGAATIERSLFQDDILGLEVTGGSTTSPTARSTTTSSGSTRRARGAASRQCSAVRSSTPRSRVPHNWPAMC